MSRVNTVPCPCQDRAGTARTHFITTLPPPTSHLKLPPNYQHLPPAIVYWFRLHDRRFPVRDKYRMASSLYTFSGNWKLKLADGDRIYFSIYSMRCFEPDFILKLFIPRISLAFTYQTSVMHKLQNQNYSPSTSTCFGTSVLSSGRSRTKFFCIYFK